MEGAVVARAQAYDAERELPFAVLGELVKQLAMQRAIGSADPEALSELTRISSEILRAFPGVPKPVEWSPELTPLRLADAFLKTVTAAATDSPVMLVVDDIHGADNASTAILHSVARKLLDTRVLMVVTGRISELRSAGAPSAFTTDVSIESMRTLDLEVLSVDAAKALVNRVSTTAARNAPPVDRLVRSSGGNPLAIELLTREWAEHGSDSLLRDLEALNTQPVPVLGIPRAIAVVFERQSGRLDIRIRATLGLAAVLGRRLTDLSLYDALDVTPAIAAESLSRLREEGFLREVHGDLEFRNELIRAQAYYAVANAVRFQLHRRVGELLASRQAPGATPAAIALEIAWHFLRGGSGDLAIPFAHQGAETFLSIGAPHEAEEVLSALLEVEQAASTLRRTQMLLARALLEQSKAELALPLISALASHQQATIVERAEIAMLRASAEFLLNTEPGDKYCEVAESALKCAYKTEDPNLISRALFECARAGSEQGVTQLVSIAEQGIKELATRVDISRVMVAAVTQAFCLLYRLESVHCLDAVRRAIEANSSTANAAQMAFLHSAMALALLHLGRIQESLDAYLTGFDLSRKVGDDARMSVLSSNICILLTAQGDYKNAIRWGERSVGLGESSHSSALQMTYTNLVDAYVLVGRESDALMLMDRAKCWLVPKRRWKFHCGFFIVNAAFELTRGNVSLALDIIAEMERIARDREEAVPIPGAYWKLRVFRAAHLGPLGQAEQFVEAATARLRDICPFQYLDVLAAKAWLELRTSGQNTPTTAHELDLFDRFRAEGRRALLTAQGFLRPGSLSQYKDHSESHVVATWSKNQFPTYPSGDESG